MKQVDLTKKPFYLSSEKIAWVQKTINNMSIEEKIGQLFFVAGFTTKEKELKHIIETFHPGGMMYRPFKASKIMNSHRYIQSQSNIPLFLAANLEAGGSGIIDEGTLYGTNMQVGASNDLNEAYRLGEVSVKEGKMVGCNMTFAPVIDINYNFKNPITNTRAFSDQATLVSQMGAQYVKAANDQHMAVTLKHFPGDGVDGRDHHLLTSINSLPFDIWMNTFGKAYKTSIEKDATGVMIGHIALPDYFNTIDDGQSFRDKPASLNPYLLKDVLRHKLNFNGLTITDSTLMTGFGCQGRRSELIPQAIASGCDMLLFNRNLAEDYSFMMDGYKQGVITDDRLDEALTRIIGLKAKLGLSEFNVDNVIPDKLDELILNQHQQYARGLADKSITLIKDHQNLLPLNPNTHKKIGVMYFGNPSALEIIMGGMKGIKGLLLNLIQKLSGGQKKPVDYFIQQLISKGFEAFRYELNDIFSIMKEGKQSITAWKSKFDVIIILTKMENDSNQTSLQVSYKAFGFDAPWFVKEVPTVLISVSNPYQLYDYPMIETVINAYTPSRIVYDEIIKKMVGESAFKGQSPVSLSFDESLPKTI